MSRIRRKLCDTGITKEYVKGFDYAVEDSMNNFFDTLDAYDFTIDGKSVDVGKYLSPVIRWFHLDPGGLV